MITPTTIAVTIAVAMGGNLPGLQREHHRRADQDRPDRALEIARLGNTLEEERDSKRQEQR